MQVSKKEIEDIIVRAYGISLRDIKGKRRLAPIVKARAGYCYLLNTVLDWSYPMIGREVGRHHSSVMYLLKEFRSSGKRVQLEEWIKANYSGG